MMMKSIILPELTRQCYGRVENQSNTHVHFHTNFIPPKRQLTPCLLYRGYKSHTGTFGAVPVARTVVVMGGGGPPLFAPPTPPPPAIYGTEHFWLKSIANLGRFDSHLASLVH
jgi:hypothetical protein